MNDIAKTLKTRLAPLFAVDSWRTLGEYFGVGKRAAGGEIDSADSLGEFIGGRASHVAQTALYGYMKTRAGTQFPALFEDSAMLQSINIAKWNVWLACVSDLTVYGGVLLRRRTRASAAEIREALGPVMGRALAEGGARAATEGGAAFAVGMHHIAERVSTCDWDALGDDESAFTESPQALVYWAPVADELKKRDVEIVRNSVRFRWQAVRRDLRRRLRADELLADADSGAGD